MAIRCIDGRPCTDSGFTSLGAVDVHDPRATRERTSARATEVTRGTSPQLGRAAGDPPRHRVGKKFCDWYWPPDPRELERLIAATVSAASGVTHESDGCRQCARRSRSRGAG